MPIQAHAAFSYRSDRAVPSFPDDRPLIVFDGVCVLCSGFVRFVARRDPIGHFRFAAAQSPLGQALFRHYGLDTTEFETNVLIEDGRAAGKLEAFALIVRRLGFPWSLLVAVHWLPRRLADALYDRIARSRYRLFGRTEACMVPDSSWRGRVIE